MSDRIAGRFEIVRCLGDGSLGTTYLCRQHELGLLVVLKLVAPEIARNEGDCAQLRDVLVSGYAISHPNVVKGYEYFRREDYVAYTREYVAGESLFQLLEAGPLEIRRCFRILLEIIDGLEAIHASGRAHLSLKPQNVLFTSDGSIKLSDFGIAQIGQAYRERHRMRELSAVEYEVPEILAGESCDHRADIYGVGQLAYTLLVGRPPFKGASREEVRRRRLEGVFLAPKAMNADLLESLSDIVVRALKRNPANRFQTLAEVKAALNASHAEYFPPLREPIVV